MKYIITLFFYTLFYISVWAQSPESFQYQAVVRDAGGVVLVNQSVSLKASIISGSATGTVEYVETFNVTTNAFGLITVSIGSGTPESGVFANIQWGNSIHFFKVEIDPAGLTNYVDMGTVQLLSVPYALHAKTAGNAFSGDYNDLSNTPDLSNYDSNVNDDFSGLYNDLIGKPGLQPVATSGSYTDLNNKPVLAGDVVGDIETNSVVKIQGKDISSNIPANGQVLKWNNSNQTWEPSDDALGAAGSTDGVVTGASVSGTSTKTLTLIRSNSLGDITAIFTDLVDDADADPTNEIQNLSIAGDQLSITGGNTVTLPQNVYTAGSGINVSGNQIINIAPDQTVTLTGGGSTIISGIYPDFTITSTDANTVYTGGTGININGTEIVNTSPDVPVVVNAGSGISVSGSYPNFQISNTNPDQPITITGGGSTVITGTYPNFNVTSTDANTTYSAGAGLTLTGTSFSHTPHTGDASGTTNLTVTGIQGRTVSSALPTSGQVLKYNGTQWTPSADDNSTYTQGSGINITGTTISNTSPDQIVSFTNGTGISVTGTYPDFTVTNTQPNQVVNLTGSGATTVSGTYPNYTITSTDANTTYSSGTGLTLTGTTFSHAAHSGDVNGTTNLTVTGIQGRQITSNAPSNNQILKWNSTNSKWELGEDELGAAGTNDGVVTSIGVSGTTTKTITLTRSQSLPDLTATFTDDGSVYNSGTGINIAGSTITNTAPDQTVTLTGGGSTSITGTYPNFSVTSTDANTTYSAGTGLTLAGTEFSHPNHSGDVTGSTSLTVTGFRGRTISTTTPTNGQVLKYNGTQWAPTSDDNTTYSAGSGLTLVGSTFNNSAPDQTVTLTGGGSTSISGTYPNFTISSTDANSGGTVTSVATGTGLTGGTITSSGTVALTGQALAFHNLASNGIVTRTALGTIAARTLTGSTSISVTNGNGVSGNPTFAAIFGTTSGTIAEGNHSHSSYTAGGTNGMVQFNNSGAFGGVQGFIWDNTNNRLMINGATTTSRQSHLVIRQTTNALNSTLDSALLANMAMDIRQNSTSNNYGAGIKFTNGNGSNYTGTAAIFASQTSYYNVGDLHFAVNNSYSAGKTAIPIRMTLKNTGNVGIGTTNPLAQLEVKGEGSSATEPLFEVKNRAGQTVFIVYEDSVRIYVDDDPAKSNKGTFAVSGRNSAKAFTNNYLVVDPDKTKIFTGDDDAGFQVNTLNGGTKSYMELTPKNILIGDSTGYSISSATDNVFVGNKVGKKITTGGSNTLIGYQAGVNITSGSSQNVIIGKNAGPSASVLANVYIGNNCGADAGAGMFNTMTGNGAGQNSTGGLHCFFGTLAGYASTGVGSTYIGVYAGQGFSGDNNTFVGKYAGNWLSTSTENTVVLGDENITSMYCVGAYDGAVTTVSANRRDLYSDNTGKIGYITSSIRYKTNISNMENLNWFYQLRPVNYTYKTDKLNSKQYGLIAEEVEKVNPLFISYNKDGSVETVNYSMFITPMIKAIQDQKLRIDELEKENINLKDKNTQIESILSEIETLKLQLKQLQDK